MSNTYFKFKQFTIHQDKCAMKVSTDACLFGAWIAQQKLQGNLLDVGTGTGLLSCIIAQQHCTLMIDAIERDTSSYEQAKENIVKNSFTNINIIYDDFFNYTTSKQYDAIVCNPPFYKNHLKSKQVQHNTAKHFDDAAFNSLFIKIYELSNSNTSIYLLLSAEQYTALIQLMRNNNLHVNEIIFIKHKTTHQAIRVFLKASLTASSTINTSEIIIKNEDDSYTSIFSNLLQDYYLAF
ncbi:MAG: methyltransferase [Chitinophagales bacterium]|nr:methyltransferase [Chitinophagales bacterium]